MASKPQIQAGRLNLLGFDFFVRQDHAPLNGALDPLCRPDTRLGFGLVVEQREKFLFCRFSHGFSVYRV